MKNTCEIVIDGKKFEIKEPKVSYLKEVRELTGIDFMSAESLSKLVSGKSILDQTDKLAEVASYLLIPAEENKMTREEIYKHLIDNAKFTELVRVQRFFGKAFSYKPDDSETP